MNSQMKIAMIGLCVSAAVMAGVLGVAVHSDTAEAGEAVGGGHYIMFTGDVPGNTDALYVIDRRSQKLNIYEFSGAAAGNQLLLSNQLNLGKAFR